MGFCSFGMREKERMIENIAMGTKREREREREREKERERERENKREGERERENGVRKRIFELYEELDERTNSGQNPIDLWDFILSV